MEITTQILLWGAGIAFIMGAVANKTNFCTMGAVSDMVNMGDKGRWRAWLLAIATAILGVTIFEATSGATIDGALPPYRSSNFAWLRYIVGGFLFGVGMTYGSGCGNKTMIRIGGGNLKSILVLIVAGIFAYLMTKTSFYEVLFHGWVTATSIDLSRFGLAGQDVGAVVAGSSGVSLETTRLVAGLVIAGLLLIYIFKEKSFWKSFDNILGGLVVGGCVVAAWYVTAGPMGQQWQEAVEWLDRPPINVAPQSYTFINPMGETLAWLMDPTNLLLISFGVAALFGVILGSMFWSIVTKGFRLEWFSSLRDVVNHSIGGMLMGIGGVLGMGCTIGQGVTGFSTLAFGSMLAFISIVFGSALTMKVQYYKLVYEEEATFMKALLSSLVDMKLLPKGLRKLDAV